MREDNFQSCNFHKLFPSTNNSPLGKKIKCYYFVYNPTYNLLIKIH